MHGMKWPCAGFCAIARFSAGRISPFFLLFFVFVSAGFDLVYGQPGFISIDCGASQTAVSGNLSWSIDEGYTNLGQNAEISAQFPYNTLRYFPDATVAKSCYVFNTTANVSYLIRAGFMYGNYDNLSATEGEPSFVLLFGPNVWSNVEFSNISEVVTHEMIVLASSDTASVCLARSGAGGRNPFISSLEIRRLFPNKMYPPAHQSFLMKTNSRINFGDNGNISVRFPDDVYDRIWMPDSEAVANISNYYTILTTNDTVSVSSTDNLPPSKVMQTARSSNKTENMSFAFNATFGPGQYYLALYFAEIQNSTSEKRIMDIYVDGTESYHALNILNISGLYNALELFYNNYTVADGNYTLSLIPNDNSTVAPIINAAESYFLQSRNDSTYGQDVQALESIKTSFNLSKWMGDPCIPNVYKWSWLDCDSINSQTRVIALNLSGFGLRSEIPPSLGDLSALTSVDLHNNFLFGEIPSFLANLSSLKFLDLSFNNLSGGYPTSLNKLDFNISGNPLVCIDGSCSNGPISQSHSSRPVGAIIGSVVASFFVFVAAVLIGALYRRKFQNRKEVFLTHSAHWPPVPPFTEIAKSVDSGVTSDGALHDVSVFSLADLQKITNNFGAKMANGVEGNFYQGTFPDGQEVVVKLLNCDISQTPMEFLYNVTPLSYVNHRNLLTPIGFGAEHNHFALIYEGAYSGTLYDYLHGKSFLDWRTRSSILQQVAQGLEHLHSSGIAHGNLTSRNVLLTGEGFLAKVADFGLYKLSSDVNTTLGYLDPEDKGMKTLIEKRDIYSFGVLILEVVSGPKPSDQSFSKDARNIIDRVRKMYEGGEGDLTADSSFGGNYNKSAMLKIIKLALEATASTVDDRPSMTQLVMELKEAHKIELGHHVAFTGLDASNPPDDVETPFVQSL